MNHTLINNPKRVIPFLFGCILFRSLLVYLAYVCPPVWLKRIGYLALIPGIGFLVIWLTGARKTGPETFGAPIWWNNLRPIHGMLYLLFAIFAIHGDNENAWKVLALDVIIGLASWVNSVSSV